jgi:hypothetical protein
MLVREPQERQVLGSLSVGNAHAIRIDAAGSPG